MKVTSWKIKGVPLVPPLAGVSFLKVDKDVEVQ